MLKTNTYSINPLYKQSGFTLIEFVVVIVILGILAVTAAPKFLNLNSSAIIASTEGLKSAINSAASMTYSKAVIENKEKLESAEVTISGTDIAIVYGYPAANLEGIDQALNIETSLYVDSSDDDIDEDWHSRVSTYSGAWVYWHGNISSDVGSVECYLRYRQSTEEGKVPVIDVEVDDC